MVDFNTRVFTEDDGKIIGAEITVYSDSGDKIGLIDIADAETLEEMQAQLAVIDETYFTEARLATILANTNEDTVINATKLSGFLSSDFAKVSDLSNYARTGHTHSRTQITNLYDYQIYASAYNAKMDSSVTITVKVTNRATGNPVVGLQVPVLKNQSAWKTLTTNANGMSTTSYTCNSWGATTFSVNTSQIQIKVDQWKKVQLLTTGVNLFTNGKQGKLVINIPSYTTTSARHKLCDLPAAYKPLEHHRCLLMDSTNVMNAFLTPSSTEVMLNSNAMSGATYTNLQNTIVYDLETPLY